MFVFWNQAENVKRKKNPIKLRRQCGNCNETALFYECEKVEEFKLYGLVNVWDKKTVVMQCGECLAIFKAEDDPDVQKSIDKRDREKSEKEEAKRAKAEADRRAKAEAEQRKEEEKRRKEFEKKEKKRNKEVDEELEALKRQMGQ